MELEGSLPCSKQPAIMRILSQMTPVHALPSHLFKMHYNIILPPTIGSSQSAPSGFTTKTLYTFLSSPHDPPFHYAYSLNYTDVTERSPVYGRGDEAQDCPQFFLLLCFRLVSPHVSPKRVQVATVIRWLSLPTSVQTKASDDWWGITTT